MNSRRKQKTSQEEEIQSPLGKVNKMRTFSDLAKELNRSPVYLSGLQKRFEMPVFEDTPYSDAYIAFLRAFIALRTLNISEDILLELWHLEKKLLQLLHVDSTGSRTWFLDSCTAVKHPERHLLLTNYDLGIPLNASEVQTGLNFADSAPNCSPARKWARMLCGSCVNALKSVSASSPTFLPNSRTFEMPSNGPRC